MKYTSKRKIILAKFIHPALYLLFKSISKIKVKPFHIECQKLPKQAIYVCNHTNSHDMPTFCIAVKKHVFVMAGTENLRIIDRIIFHLNGVYFINRSNKAERRNGKNYVIEILKCGQNAIIFPEGSWNMTSNLPMLPLHWGVIDIAKESGVPIVPVVLEYCDDICIYSIGKPLYCDKTIGNQAEISNLRDEMSSLLWEIWENKTKIHDKNREAKTWNKIIDTRLSEYPLFDPELEKTFTIYKNENINDLLSQEHMHLKPTIYNAFLFNKRLK